MGVRKTLFFIAISCASGSVLSTPMKVEGTKYGVTIDSSRIIYPLNARGVSVSVFNPQNYPILVSSRVLDEEREKTDQFFVTPPLFRLDAEQRYTLRVTRTGEEFPGDKESLFWFCSKGIPPKADDLWAGDVNATKYIPNDIGISLNISIDNCIKLIVRPEKLERDELAASKISWKVTDGKLVGYNPTAFYINIGKIKFNGKELRANYIPPNGKQTFPLDNGEAKTGKVEWQALDDHGSLRSSLTKQI